MDAFGGNDEDSAELRKLNAEVVGCVCAIQDESWFVSQTEDNDNFEIWEKLVRTAETLEGGINRNSSPQAITSVRNVYDRFLAKFPLFFGYWKKYADLEFSIAGTEAAEMVRWNGAPFATTLIFAGLRARCRKHH
jgi:pre-mRNA-processing factor 39